MDSNCNNLPAIFSSRITTHKPSPPPADSSPTGRNKLRKGTPPSRELDGAITAATLEYLLGDISNRADKKGHGISSHVSSWEEDLLQLLPRGDDKANSFLAAIRQFATSEGGKVQAGKHIPPSLIPSEYWIVDESPIFNFNKTDEVHFDSLAHTWKKKAFPSNKPSSRVEVYLLAKTLDQMLNRKQDIVAQIHSEQCYDTESTLFEDICTAVFEVANTGFAELVRQVYCHCIERGVLMDKMRNIYSEFFYNSIDLLKYFKDKCKHLTNEKNELSRLCEEADEGATSAKLEAEQAAIRIRQLEEDKAHLEAQLKDQEVLRALSDQYRQFIKKQAERNDLLLVHAAKDGGALATLLLDDDDKASTTSGDVGVNDSNGGGGGAGSTNEALSTLALPMPSAVVGPPPNVEAVPSTENMRDAIVQVSEWETDDLLYDKVSRFLDGLYGTASLTEQVAPMFSGAAGAFTLSGAASWAQDKLKSLMSKHASDMAKRSGLVPDRGLFVITKETMTEVLDQVMKTVLQINERLQDVLSSDKLKMAIDVVKDFETKHSGAETYATTDEGMTTITATLHNHTLLGGVMAPTRTNTMVTEFVNRWKKVKDDTTDEDEHADVGLLGSLENETDGKRESKAEALSVTPPDKPSTASGKKRPKPKGKGSKKGYSLKNKHRDAMMQDEYNDPLERLDTAFNSHEKFIQLVPIMQEALQTEATAVDKLKLIAAAVEAVTATPILIDWSAHEVGRERDSSRTPHTNNSVTNAPSDAMSRVSSPSLDRNSSTHSSTGNTFIRSSLRKGNPSADKAAEQQLMLLQSRVAEIEKEKMQLLKEKISLQEQVSGEPVKIDFVINDYGPGELHFQQVEDLVGQNKQLQLVLKNVMSTLNTIRQTCTCGATKTATKHHITKMIQEVSNLQKSAATSVGILKQTSAQGMSTLHNHRVVHQPLLPTTEATTGGAVHTQQHAEIQQGSPTGTEANSALLLHKAEGAVAQLQHAHTAYPNPSGPIDTQQPGKVNTDTAVISTDSTTGGVGQQTRQYLIDEGISNQATIDGHRSPLQQPNTLIGGQWVAEGTSTNGTVNGGVPHHLSWSIHTVPIDTNGNVQVQEGSEVDIADTIVNQLVGQDVTTPMASCNALGRATIATNSSGFVTHTPLVDGRTTSINPTSRSTTEVVLSQLAPMSDVPSAVAFYDSVTVEAVPMEPLNKHTHTPITVDAGVGTPSLGIKYNTSGMPLVTSIPKPPPTGRTIGQNAVSFGHPATHHLAHVSSTTTKATTSLLNNTTMGRPMGVQQQQHSLAPGPAAYHSANNPSFIAGVTDPRRFIPRSNGTLQEPVVTPSTRELIEHVTTPTLPFSTKAHRASSSTTTGSLRDTIYEGGDSALGRNNSNGTTTGLQQHNNNVASAPFQVVTSKDGSSRVVVVPDPSHVRFIPSAVAEAVEEVKFSAASMAQHLAVAGPLHPMLAPPATTFLKAAVDGVTSTKRHRANEYTEQAEKLRRMIGTIQTAKPKSVLWLLQLMTKMYRGKVRADVTLEGTDYKLTMSEFVFDFLKQIYGRIKLVDDYAAALVSTIQRNRDRDVRVEMFARFVSEDWGLEVLTTYLNCLRALDEAKVGPEYSRGNDDNLKPNVVSVVRALYTLGFLFKEEAKLSLLESCSKRVKDESMAGDFTEYKEGMAKAGYNLSTLVVLPDGWNCDEATARSKIRKCDFLMIVCEETHAFIYNNDAASVLF